MLLFTNTVNHLYRSFRLEIVSEILGFSIDDRLTFYVDNPYSHVQNIKLIKSGITQEDIFNIKRNFVMTFNTLENLCRKVESLQQVNLESFIDFIYLREEIERNLDELRLLEESKISLEKKIEEISKGLQGERLSFQKSDIVPTNDYATICEEPGCYSNCHHPCYYTGIVFRRVKDCKCIQDDGCCSKCTHHYSQHRRRRYLYATREVLLSMNLHDKLAAAQSKEEQNRNVLEEQRDQLRALGYKEKSDRLKKALTCSFAKFQSLGSISYHKVIDIEREIQSSLSPTAQKALEVLLRNIAEIQDLPFPDELNHDELYAWACNTLNIDPNETIDYEKVQRAYRDVSRRFCHAIKSGSDTIVKHHNRARDILLNSLG